MMRRIGEMLRLHGERAVWRVFDAAFADQRAVEKIARIELSARLVGENFEIAATVGIIDLADFGHGIFAVFIEHIVEVVTRWFVAEIVDMGFQDGGLAQVPRGPRYGANLARRNRRG